MKKIIIFFTSLLISAGVIAQTVTVNGGCIAAPVTLTQSPGLIGGKVFYEGFGTVNTTDDGPVVAPISVYWIPAESVWVVAFDGQPYFSNAANTTVPPGTASTVFSWQAAMPSVCGASGAASSLSVTGNVVLWVTFGTINASVNGNQLAVNWTTEKEVNNDHFEIEASTDGEHFTAIGSVKTKAENGNSDVILNYEWSTSANLSLAMLPYLAVVLLLLLLVRRKKTLMMASVAVSFLAFAQISCNKDKDAITAAEKYYIRIAQVDKDGTKTHSKVINVKGE